MPNVEDITPHVEITGIDEATDALRNIGEVGAAAFERIIEAAAHGDFTALATMVGGELAGSFVKAAEAVASFVEAQATAVETLSNLGAATGMTLPQIEGMQAAFASVGIGVQSMERAIGRLAITIGNDWASIQQSVRTAADTQQAALTDMEEAASGVQKAQAALQATYDDNAKAAEKNALAVEESALSLTKAENAMKDLASASVHNTLGIEGAAESLERAQLNLQKVLNPQADFSGEEKALKIKEAQLAVQKAQQDLEDAKQKKADENLKREEALLSIQRAHQALQDAADKRDDDVAKAREKEKDAHFNVEKTIERETAATEKAHDADLKNIPKITQEVEQVASGYKTWDEVINHTEISAQNLTKAIILAASGGSGEPPKTAAVFEEMNRVFSQMGDSADDMNKKLEIVQHAMSAGFRSGQASAAQLLALLNRTPEAFAKLNEEAAKFSKSGIGVSEADEKALTQFNSDLTELTSIIDQVKSHLAAVAATPLGNLFKEIKESLEDTNGAWHIFVEGLEVGLKLVIGAAKGVADVFEDMFRLIEKATEAARRLGEWWSGNGAKAKDTAAGKSDADSAGGGGGTAGGSAASFLSGVAQGLKGIFDGLTHPIQSLADAMVEHANAAASKTTEAAEKSDAAAEKHTEAAEKHVAAAGALGSAGDALGSAADALKAAVANLAALASQRGDAMDSPVAGGIRGATGGSVHGPGSGTSDEAGLFALSNGEYVMREAAVSHYGASLFHALNGLAVGGFAMGGMVGGARAPTVATGPGGGPSSVLNLTIDGQHFNGLRAPEHVASKLKTYAVTRQASSAGKMPSWMR